MEKKCLECGDEIFGRVDKKFCGDQCRNLYNNKLNGQNTNYIRNINRILKKNRNIMESLCPNEKSKVKKDKLLSLGFKFNYFTNIYETKEGRRYYYCYDFAYLQLDENWYALVKKKDWVDKD